MTRAVWWWVLGALGALALIVPIVVFGVRDINAQRDYLAKHCAPTGETETRMQPIHVGPSPRIVPITRSEWRCDDGGTLWR